MVGVLDLAQISQLSWKLEDSFVGVQISKLKEVYAFLGENFAHANQISI